MEGRRGISILASGGRKPSDAENQWANAPAHRFRTERTLTRLSVRAMMLPSRSGGTPQVAPSLTALRLEVLLE
jgi:hypothetical protein